MIKIRTEEFKCLHGEGWRSWAENGEGKSLALAWERDTAKESKLAATNFFEYMDTDIVICRTKPLRK